MTFDLTISTIVDLPVLPINNVVAIPNSDIRYEFTTANDSRALKAAAAYQNYVVLASPIYPGIEYETIEGFYKRAVIAKIVLNSNPSTSVNRTKFEVIMRCDILELKMDGVVNTATVSTTPSYVSDYDKTYGIINVIKKQIADNKGATPEDQVMMQKISLALGKNNDLAVTADTIVGYVNTGVKDRFKYLFDLDVTNRFYGILNDIKKKAYIGELEQKIEEDVRKNMGEAQKEYYLREKMRAIQEELGDKGKKDEDIENMRTAIKEAKLPKSVEEKALNELSRYQLTPSSSPESNIIKSYLDFILSLPWSKSSEDCDDINRAKQILDEDHYGLDKVKDRILEYLAVKILTKKNPQTILCLAGPPGVGKTSLAMSIARALNKSFVKQSLGGVKDESEVRGHRRTYIGALPGRILQSLAKAKTNNPVFLLDEIDKMSSDYKGDPTSAMLEVLDPEQNKFFSDNYLEEPFDLSKCFFIATANYLENIPAPLRDRLEIVQVSSYTEYEKFEIAKRHLLKKQLELNGLTTDKFSIDDDVIYEIIRSYTREAGVRQLERLLGKIIRKAIKMILMDNKDSINVTVDNLEDFLGKKIFADSETLDSDLVGVVNGLAYTEFGGDTLQIEVAQYKGHGHIQLTGKIGDVMKESAETALSYVKANASEYSIDYETFANSDIHIHFPEGAVPKDGPSAGVTIVTAIVSCFTNRPANHLVGMTGEITLRGRVLPIGGLREKAIAAHRNGLKKILIPKENLKDLDEIPSSVKEALEIIPIEKASEAIFNTLL